MDQLANIVQDLRYGARQLRLNPGFTAVAVLSLALGVGANTAIFQLLDAVRIRTLPVANPQELAYLDFAKGSQRSGWFSSRNARFTSAHWEELQNHSEPFRGLLAWSAAGFNLSPGGEVRNAEGVYVSANFFPVLGVEPILGRTFTREDDRPGCGSPGAVVSYAFWQRELGGDPNALGRTITLDGHVFPVIGVTPAGFFGVEVGRRFDVAVPLCADALLSADGKGRAPKRGAWWLSAMGRLKPGWNLQRATTYLQTMSPAIMEATLPSDYRPDVAKKYLANKLEATTGANGVSGLRRQYESPLWLLLGTTALVLLIACANLANLLLARASIREREIALRLAIGASRGRLIAQLLSESLLLALAGTVLGTLLAQILSRGLVAFLTTSGNRMFVGLEMDLRMLAFTVGIAAATCLLFGLLPALRATGIAPGFTLRSSGRGMTAGRERFSLRRALVTAQVALSLVLLVGALLFVRSFQKLARVDPGFRPEGVVAVDLDLRRPEYDKKRLPGIYRGLLDQLGAQPGVISVAQVLLMPIGGGGWNEMVWAEGSPEGKKESYFNRVSTGYFRTMGVGLIAGRDFDQRDTVNSPKVAIVNEAFVKRFFSGGNPVGRVFRVEGPAGKPDPVYQVIGMVRNTKYYEVREDFLPVAFLPAAQDENPGPEATYMLRTAAPLGSLFENIKRAVAEVHPSIGIQFTVMSTQLKESLVRDRLMAILAGAFGLLAGVLATLGLYGVIAYMVARRRNEIGVRMALGADRGSVIRLVLREAGLLLVVGLAVGAGLAFWAGRAAASLLFDLKPTDPATFGAAIALLAAVTLVASYAPARKASRIEPMQALREE